MDGHDNAPAAGRLLVRAGGSSVSATTVMRAMRQTGGLRAAEDAELARSFYGSRVLPGGGRRGRGGLCLEADGAWLSLQKPKASEPRRCETKAVVAYAGKKVRDSMDAIGVEGHALGTMESENQHLYGVRTDSLPCARSVREASNMARIRSKSRSHRAIPRITRERSATPRRRDLLERRELEALTRRGLSASSVVESCGKGREAPCKVSVSGLPAEVRFAAGIDKGMVAIGGQGRSPSTLRRPSQGAKETRRPKLV